MFLRNRLFNELPVSVSPTFACLLTILKLVICKHSFSVSIRFCKFVVHPLSGCECFCAFSCSISTTLAFHFVFACLLTTVLLVAIVFVILVAH